MRFAPSAWPTTSPPCDRAIGSRSGPSPRNAIARRGIERFEGRALGMRTQRAANEPSFEWSRDLLVGAPGPDREILVGGCPSPSARQRDLGVDEASKVCDQQAELPAADSVQSRARPTWIDRGSQAPLPTGTAKRFAEIRLRGEWHTAPAVGRTLLLQPPPHAAIGRRERALSSALMPGCPARGRRSQTSTGPTLLRSQPNTRLPTDVMPVR
jgi:hypothetical protein